MAELIVVVFEPGRPIARECPFDTAACSNAGARVQSFKAEAGPPESARDAVFVACPGGTALDVKQPAVHRISETGGYAWKEIRSRGDKRRLAGVTQGEHDPRVAFHGCP